MLACTAIYPAGTLLCHGTCSSSDRSGCRSRGAGGAGWGVATRVGRPRGPRVLRRTPRMRERSRLETLQLSGIGMTSQRTRDRMVERLDAQGIRDSAGVEDVGATPSQDPKRGVAD